MVPISIIKSSHGYTHDLAPSKISKTPPLPPRFSLGVPPSEIPSLYHLAPAAPHQALLVSFVLLNAPP